MGDTALFIMRRSVKVCQRIDEFLTKCYEFDDSWGANISTSDTF